MRCSCNILSTLVMLRFLSETLHRTDCATFYLGGHTHKYTFGGTLPFSLAIQIYAPDWRSGMISVSLSANYDFVIDERYMKETFIFFFLNELVQYWTCKQFVIRVCVCVCVCVYCGGLRIISKIYTCEECFEWLMGPLKINLFVITWMYSNSRYL